MDEAYNCLMKNIRLNHLNNVKPFKLALWSSETTLKLYRTKGYFTSAISRVDVFKKLIQQKKLELIKEYEILKGSEYTLKLTKYLIIEVSADLRQILDFLEKRGFTVLNLGEFYRAGLFYIYAINRRFLS